jgi:hypothetical protein
LASPGLQAVAVVQFHDVTQTPIDPCGLGLFDPLDISFVLNNMWGHDDQKLRSPVLHGIVAEKPTHQRNISENRYFPLGLGFAFRNQTA